MNQPVPNCCQCIIPWTQSGVRAWFVTTETLTDELADPLTTEAADELLAETKG